MSFILILIATLCIVGIGFLVLTLFGLLKDETLIARLAYSWGLGVGLISLQMALYSLLKMPWNWYWLVIPWMIILAFNLISVKKISNHQTVRINLNKSEWLFLMLIFLLIGFVCFESILRPIPAWDGWAHWLLRSKIFYINHNFSSQAAWYTQSDYPAVIPLLGTFGYIMMGGINDTTVLFLFFMFYLALGGVFYSVAKRMLGRQAALILTFLLLSLQDVIRYGGRFEVGQADLALGYYIFASTWLLVKFFETKSRGTLVLLSILLGFTAQIKNDGMPMVIASTAIIVIMILKWRKYTYFLGLLPIVFILLPWEIYKKVTDVPQNFIFISAFHPHFDKIVNIILAMFAEFINFQNWSILWIVFFSSLLLFNQRFKHVKFFLFVFCVQWLSYFLIFIISPREPVGHVQNIIDKLYIQIAPLAVITTGVLLQKHLHFDQIWKLDKVQAKTRSKNTRKKDNKAKKSTKK